MIKRLNNQNGVTMVEAIMAAAGLIFIVLAVMVAGQTLFNIENSTSRILDLDKIVSGFSEQIREEPQMYLVDFSPDTISDDTILSFDNLPLAYRKDYFGPVSGCPTCKVRVGYVIRPVRQNKGLSRLIVRAKNSETNEMKEYRAILSTY